MYYNKKRMKAVALMGVILLLGVCGCTAEASKPEEQKQKNMVETVTEAVEQDEVEITQAVTQQPAEITQAVTEKEEEIAGPGGTGTPCPYQCRGSVLYKWRCGCDRA